MTNYVLWAVVMAVTGAAVLWSTSWIEATWAAVANRRVTSTRHIAVAIVVALAVLIVLGAAYHARAVAKPDAALIARLAVKPGSALAQIMTYVTVLGDAIPSLLLATLLAVVVYRQGRYGWLVAVLPVVVLAELVVQIGVGKVFHDVTIGQLHATVPIGGVGRIPSGSVARLLSIFLTAAALWHAHDARASSRVVSVAAALTLVQAISRLILGRHLFADILGGVALGVALALAAVLVLRVPALRRTVAVDDPRGVARRS